MSVHDNDNVMVSKAGVAVVEQSYTGVRDVNRAQPTCQ
jgi:hypothetical protein